MFNPFLHFLFCTELFVFYADYPPPPARPRVPLPFCFIILVVKCTPSTPSPALVAQPLKKIFFSAPVCSQFEEIFANVRNNNRNYLCADELDIRRNHKLFDVVEQILVNIFIFALSNKTKDTVLLVVE